jgi:apolipoprotein N-acyltransferase
VYLLSFVFIGLAILGYLFARRQPLPYIVAAVVVLVVTQGWSWSFSAPSNTNQSIEIAVVDTAFKNRGDTTGAQFKQKQTLDQAVAEALALEPDYLILPESAEYFSPANNQKADRQKLFQHKSFASTTIIDSRPQFQAQELVLESYIYESSTDNFITVDKRYLVPQGEYMPSLYSKLFKLFGQTALVEYVEDNLSYRVGRNIHQGRLAPDSPAVLFCFESVDPRGVKVIMSEHPDAPFVAHIVSHAWFQESPMFWDQLDAMLQVQAVWNQKYIVTASNLGRSRTYTPNGDMLEMREVVTGSDWSVKTISIPQSAF